MPAGYRDSPLDVPLAAVSWRRYSAPMAAPRFFSQPVSPDWEAFRDCILRRGTPRRVHHIELCMDREMQDTIIERFGLADSIRIDDPFRDEKVQVKLQRFLGYDYVRVDLGDMSYPLNQHTAPDTADRPRAGGRSFMDLHRGPISSWEDFERYPWPNPDLASRRAFEWYERNLPDDMCVIAGHCHFAELLSWLMGYETLCYSLVDQPDLVHAIAARVNEITSHQMRTFLQFTRVKAVWGSDDMGFRTGLLMSPQDTRELVLAGHRRMAAMAHDAGRLYLLHSCGNLADIREDLVTDVRIDGRHSWEDAIEPVTEAKRTWGARTAVLGGVDMDFLCRSDEMAVRHRVRTIVEVCMPGGGWCLGTGNTAANYIPVENLLAMIDEGRRCSG
jgi:uroporphyrinogen decarboxylase